MLTLEELQTVKYLNSIDEKVISIYNSLSEEAKRATRFNVIVVNDGGNSDEDDYDCCEEYDNVPAFELPEATTPDGAVAYLKGCCINEVYYQTYLQMTYPEGRGLGSEILGKVDNWIE